MQDLIGLNDKLVKDDPKLSKMVAEVIENNEHGSDIDPMAFPWDQNARHIYGFVYIVNLTNPETFDTMKDFIDKIS